MFIESRMLTYDSPDVWWRLLLFPGTETTYSNRPSKRVSFPSRLIASSPACFTPLYYLFSSLYPFVLRLSGVNDEVPYCRRRNILQESSIMPAARRRPAANPLRTSVVPAASVPAAVNAAHQRVVPGTSSPSAATVPPRNVAVRFIGALLTLVLVLSVRYGVLADTTLPIESLLVPVYCLVASFSGMDELNVLRWPMALDTALAFGVVITVCGSATVEIIASVSFVMFVLHCVRLRLSISIGYAVAALTYWAMFGKDVPPRPSLYGMSVLLPPDPAGATATFQALTRAGCTWMGVNPKAVEAAQALSSRVFDTSTTLFERVAAPLLDVISPWYLLSAFSTAFCIAYVIKANRLLSSQRAAYQRAANYSIIAAKDAAFKFKIVSVLWLALTRVHRGVGDWVGYRWMAAFAVWYAAMLVEWHEEVSVGGLLMVAALSVGLGASLAGEQPKRGTTISHLALIVIVWLCDVAVYFVCPSSYVIVVANAVVAAYILHFFMSPVVKASASAAMPTSASSAAPPQGSPGHAAASQPPLFGDMSLLHTDAAYIKNLLLPCVMWILMVGYDALQRYPFLRPSSSSPHLPTARLLLAVNTIGYGTLMMTSSYLDAASRDTKLRLRCLLIDDTMVQLRKAVAHQQRSEMARETAEDDLINEYEDEIDAVAAAGTSHHDDGEGDDDDHQHQDDLDGEDESQETGTGVTRSRADGSTVGIAAAEHRESFGEFESKDNAMPFGKALSVVVPNDSGVIDSSNSSSFVDPTDLSPTAAAPRAALATTSGLKTGPSKLVAPTPSGRAAPATMPTTVVANVTTTEKELQEHMRRQLQDDIEAQEVEEARRRDKNRRQAEKKRLLQEQRQHDLVAQQERLRKEAEFKEKLESERREREKRLEEEKLRRRLERERQEAAEQVAALNASTAARAPARSSRSHEFPLDTVTPSVNAGASPAWSLSKASSAATSTVTSPLTSATSSSTTSASLRTAAAVKGVPLAGTPLPAAATGRGDVAPSSKPATAMVKSAISSTKPTSSTTPPAAPASLRAPGSMMTLPVPKSVQLGAMHVSSPTHQSDAVELKRGSAAAPPRPLQEKKPLLDGAPPAAATAIVGGKRVAPGTAVKGGGGGSTASTRSHPAASPQAETSSPPPPPPPSSTVNARNGPAPIPGNTPRRDAASTAPRGGAEQQAAAAAGGASAASPFHNVEQLLQMVARNSDAEFGSTGLSPSGDTGSSAPTSFLEEVLSKVNVFSRWGATTTTTNATVPNPPPRRDSPGDDDSTPSDSVDAAALAQGTITASSTTSQPTPPTSAEDDETRWSFLTDQVSQMLDEGHEPDNGDEVRPSADREAGRSLGDPADCLPSAAAFASEGGMRQQELSFQQQQQLFMQQQQQQQQLAMYFSNQALNQAVVRNDGGGLHSVMYGTPMDLAARQQQQQTAANAAALFNASSHQQQLQLQQQRQQQQQQTSLALQQAAFQQLLLAAAAGGGQQAASYPVSYQVTPAQYAAAAYGGGGAHAATTSVDYNNTGAMMFAQQQQQQQQGQQYYAVPNGAGGYVLATMAAAQQTPTTSQQPPQQVYYIINQNVGVSYLGANGGQGGAISPTTANGTPHTSTGSAGVAAAYYASGGGAPGGTGGPTYYVAPQQQQPPSFE